MKVMIPVDTEKNNQDEIIALVEYLFTKSDSVVQTQLTNDKQNINNSNGKDRKYFCNNPGCKKEITKDIVAYCLHKDNKDRFKGKVYCRSCQEGR